MLSQIYESVNHNELMDAKPLTNTRPDTFIILT